MQSASEYCSPARGRNETVEVTSEIARRLGGAAVVLELVRNEMGRCERGGSYIMKRCPCNGSIRHPPTERSPPDELLVVGKFSRGG